VDMVNISVDFDNLKFRVLALQGQYEVFQILTNTALKELATEFGREDNMISGVKNGMGLSAILHPYILTEDSGTGPSAGYRPQFLPGNDEAPMMSEGSSWGPFTAIWSVSLKS